MSKFNKSWRDNKRGYKKEDYVPITERDDWDGEVIQVKPHKNYEWTGRPFESRVGKRGRD